MTKLALGTETDTYILTRAYSKMRCGKCGKNQRGPAANGVCRCPGQVEARDTQKRAYPEGVAVERKGSKKVNQLEQERARHAAMIKGGGSHTDEVSVGTGSDTSGG